PIHAPGQVELQNRRHQAAPVEKSTQRHPGILVAGLMDRFLAGSDQRSFPEQRHSGTSQKRELQKVDVPAPGKGPAQLEAAQKQAPAEKLVLGKTAQAQDAA